VETGGRLGDGEDERKEMKTPRGFLVLLPPYPTPLDVPGSPPPPCFFLAVRFPVAQIG
jgi:hypothetical protein